MSTAVQPEKILKDLQNLWIDLAKEDVHKGGVLRACAMTLIAAVEQECDAQSAGETIANLMHQHPSRVIVMKISSDSAAACLDRLEARVFAQCWMPFGRRQQICCEEIEITASDSRIDDLPKLLLGLIAPDLPVVLWCHSERLCRNASFQQIYPLTDKLIIDSAAFADPRGAVDFIAGLFAQGRNVADLAWTRLTQIRETVSQIFENESARAQLKGLRRIHIAYAGPTKVAGDSTPTSLRYLTAWFKTILPSVSIETKYQAQHDAFALRMIRLEGEGFTASVELQDSAADVTVNGMLRRVAFPRPEGEDLLRDELAILGVDSIFRRSLG